MQALLGCASRVSELMCPSCSCSGGRGSEAEHKLFSVIFSNYNQYIRPVENVTDPVIVQFEVSMSQLVKVVSGSAGKCKWFLFSHACCSRGVGKGVGFEQKAHHHSPKLCWRGCGVRPQPGGVGGGMLGSDCRQTRSPPQTKPDPLLLIK